MQHHQNQYNNSTTMDGCASGYIYRVERGGLRAERSREAGAQAEGRRTSTTYSQDSRLRNQCWYIYPVLLITTYCVHVPGTTLHKHMYIHAAYGHKYGEKTPPHHRTTRFVLVGVLHIYTINNSPQTTPTLSGGNKCVV